MALRTDPRELIDRHRARILAIPGVVGVSFGLRPGTTDSRCVLVHASSAAWPPALPHDLEGYEVVLIPVPGGFRAL